MDTNSIIIGAIVLIVFFALALVAIFRFDKVKNTIELFGIKIGISGSKTLGDTKANRGRGKPAPNSEMSGDASIKIRGKVSDSKLSAESSNKSTVQIGKDVKNTDIRAKAGKPPKG